MTIDYLTHRFLKSVPERLEPGVLYVSIEYDTTIHLCACGCGNQVVLPLHPTAWRLTYDGETVSMAPSVGNWSFPCRSHYWIDRGRVRWAPVWSDAQVSAGRLSTLREREAFGADVEEALERELSVWQRVVEAVRGFLGRP
jgi:hypothetical protein